VDQKDTAIKCAHSRKARPHLRITHIEYVPTDPTEFRARFFRVLDLLDLKREILPPLAEPEEKSSIK